MVRLLNAQRCLLAAAWLIGCASGEPLQAPNDERDASAGAGGDAITTGSGTRSGSGGFAANGGNGGWGGVRDAASAGTGGGAGNSGGAGGALADATAERDGASGASSRDASSEAGVPVDVVREDGPETGVPDGGEVEGGTCGAVFCFDVFECWIFFPQCGYTACELFTCKK